MIQGLLIRLAVKKMKEELDGREERIKKAQKQAQVALADFGKDLTRIGNALPGAVKLDVKTGGFDDLAKDLRKLGRVFPTEMKAINYAIAEEIVIPEARRRASGVIGKTGAGNVLRPGAKVVGDIRSMRQAGRGVVAIGSAKVPWAAGMEFGASGARTAKGGNTSQFAAWRGRGGSAGYFLYPTIRDNQERIKARYGEMIDDLLKSHMTN